MKSLAVTVEHLYALQIYNLPVNLYRRARQLQLRRQGGKKAREGSVEVVLVECITLGADMYVDRTHRWLGHYIPIEYIVAPEMDMAESKIIMESS